MGMRQAPEDHERELRFRETAARIYDELFPAAQEALDGLLERLGGRRDVVLKRGLSVRNIGRAAGKCTAGGEIIVNSQLIDFPDDLRNTVAHELAHAVVETARISLLAMWAPPGGPATRRNCRRRTGPWSAHGDYWKAVAAQLGDTGDRCHQLPLKPVRKLRRYLYRADCGTEMVLSSVRHRRLQREPGFAYHWPRKAVTVYARHLVGEVEDE